MKQFWVHMVLVLAAAQSAWAIDYHKNVITGPGGSNRTSFSSSSSSFSMTIGSNGVMSSGASMTPSRFDFDEFGGFGRKTLDQRIREAEQRLNKLLFIRDVCRKLEDEIRITFEKKEIRDVLAQVSETLGTPLPFEVPEGTFIIEKSDVAGMPADRFLESVAQVAGLTLKYEPKKLVFEKAVRPE